MVDKGKVILSQGEIYLARLDPAKGGEIGKIRPIIILTSPIILHVEPQIVFICPLSRKSYPDFSFLHVQIPPRENLISMSYAVIDHCRSVSTQRLIYPRLAQLTHEELDLVLRKMKNLVGL